ncbi:unnamed protein product [Adineta steineri]|uniref:Protein kinase domain-containing protein n=1 Tax=Adineta steineri TaxID=433720 RepID=A0A815EFL3_9BILA|nr:unnamed protein product [Adineta steineri]CAF3693525.1 unnamed protein product [Adineta steineri]
MKSKLNGTSSFTKQTLDIIYIESNLFQNQFCINKRKTRSIKNHSRFSLVSITESKSNEFNEYLQERQYMIENFNKFLTTQLRADENLSLDSFKLIHSLGKGGYGSVFLAYHNNTNEYVALKAIKKSTLIENNEQNTILSERQYAFALHHPNIVQFITSFKDNEYVYIGFEWLQGGDLYSLMSYQKLTELQAKFYAAQIVMALDYLHGCKIVYRDLKPENIVLTCHGYIKLIDLGLAKLIRGYSETFCGTPHYIAPEILMHRPYTISPDYWTLGIIIHEMVTGLAPYDRTYRIHENESTENEYDNRSTSTIENSSSDIIRPTSKHYNMYHRIITGCSSMHLKDITHNCSVLIHDLLQHNINQRLGCRQRGILDIFEHPWFNQINFWNLYQQKYLPPFIPLCKYFPTNKYQSETILKFTANKQYEYDFIEF